ncbi:hypothetical protein JN531_012510 [Flagellatimonas centrodinii]|uniref:hypothetical protein n=1 Tax=Flagellatimonas centrodinii TaxID=2806210 RepID=UPI001FEEE9DE|nr:hypothetical protein [Flagellatimonas centrodinii]ULQ45921.1 hypothetical protein JN531_012510 [Flagellatimonas centrodinii]
MTTPQPNPEAQAVALVEEFQLRALPALLAQGSQALFASGARALAPVLDQEIEALCQDQQALSCADLKRYAHDRWTTMLERSATLVAWPNQITSRDAQ